VFHANLTLVQTGARENERIGRLRNRTEPLRVWNGLNLVHELEVREVVDKDLLFDDDNDAVAAEADAAHGGAEGELADAVALVVVPDHDLVGRVLRVRPAADEGEDVAEEEHLHVADSAAVEIAPEELAEGVAVVDAEAVVCGGGEAGLVLVEGEVEERRRRERWGGFRRRCVGGGVVVGRWRFGLRRHEGVEVEGLRLVGEEIRVWI